MLTRDQQRTGIMAFGPGSTKEHELSWMDWSVPADLSADGNNLLFDEQGEEVWQTIPSPCVTWGSPPEAALAKVWPVVFSQMEKWAIAIVSNAQLLLLPTGAGTAKRIERHDIEQYGIGSLAARRPTNHLLGKPTGAWGSLFYSEHRRW